MATIPGQSPQTEQFWPPDDTEESVVGTSRHQLTIRHLCWGINEIAGAAVGGSAQWHADSQIMLTGFSRPNGSPYVTLPDVFVYRQALPPDDGSHSILEQGPPLLIIEVASESTHRSDTDLLRGKAWSYSHAGVREYLVLDPTTQLIGATGRGWRFGGGFQVWEAGDDGIWWSDEIPVGFSVDDESITVHGRASLRVPREGETLATLRRKDEELARQGEELARRDRELARQREELARKDAELADLRRRLELGGGR
jgi:Putative restriction endonuclease